MADPSDKTEFGEGRGGGKIAQTQELSGSGRARRRRPMYFPMSRRLLERPELDDTYQTDSSGSYLPNIQRAVISIV